jgi:RNA polymerase sigma-70 factor (ECF subfamily)
VFLSLEGLPADADLVDESATPEERATVASIYRLLERLPVRQRVAWVLKHVEGETLDAIAVLCRCSKATVQRRLRAAEEALRLEREAEEHHGRLGS